MSDRLFAMLTMACAVGCGLNAGVFFAFSAFVMKALARLPAAQGIAAMNAINLVAVTPAFMTALFGTAAACVVLAAWTLWPPARPAAVYLVGGAACYLVGAILVTMIFNVPRNDALAAANPADVNAGQIWADYVATWTAWNHVRTVASLIAAVLLTNGSARLR